MFENEQWIEKNIREYGNCVLARWRIDRFGGKKVMIEKLTLLGLQCEFIDLNLHKEKGYVKCYIIYDIKRRTIAVD